HDAELGELGTPLSWGGKSQGLVAVLDVLAGGENSQAVGDGDKLQERLSVQLVHHLLSMRLDGSLGGTERKGDLLVDLAARHQGKHFALPGCQTREPRLQSRNALALRQRRPATVECAAYGVQ